MRPSKQDILSNYNRRIDSVTSEIKSLDRIIRNISIGRLAVFIIAIPFIYLLFNNFDNGIPVLILLLAASFLYLVKQHEKYLKKREFYKKYLQVNNEEIPYHHNRWSSFDSGDEFLKKSSVHAVDLDVFGENSLFQKFNRTVTLSGKNRLAHWLRYPATDFDEILQRQTAVKELCAEIDFRQHFRAHGLTKVESRGDYVRLIRWMREKPWITSRKIFSYLLYIVPIVNISVTILAILTLIPWSFPLISFILTLAFLAPLQKRINRGYLLLNRRTALLLKYVELLKLIENKEFKSSYLNDLQAEMTDDNSKAWEHIQDLAAILQKLDQRLNMLMGVFLNVYLLWDIRLLSQVEKWKNDNSDDLIVWFNNIGIFDALFSLVNIAYNEPSWVFPKLTSETLVYGKDLRHPLMDNETCVPNDIEIQSKPHFIVITGANMAGKSTWLRTVGTNYLLAMVGSVVNAVEFQFVPATIATSLRTTDSLLKSESYFYSELKRLKEIIDMLCDGKPVFVFLDEILKGTNSGDKEAGSIALLKQLIDLKAFGIIATHDLNLAKIADRYSDFIVNKRFEADIFNEKLSFDYTLKDGVAQNFNATFLMKKMGITV